MEKVRILVESVPQNERKNNLKVYTVDEWATFILAIFVFGTMYVSLSNIGL